MMYLSCPIHLEYITWNQQPVALPCGHIFCTPCLNKLYADSRIKPCPLCNKHTKKTSFLKLYVPESCSQAGSPNGTPVKGGICSFQINAEGTRIRDAFKELCSAADGNSNPILDRAAFNAAVDATQRMATFSGKVALRKEDVELKCLAQEIKDASSRFQSLLFPQFETLLDLRQTNDTLKSKNESLERKLTRRKAELDTISRKRLQQEKDKANLMMAKKLVDERVAGLEKALDVVHEKLQTAERDLATQKELLSAKHEELARYREWLAEHKHKAEKSKDEVRRLRDVLELERKTKSSSSESGSKSQPLQRRSQSQPQPKQRRLISEENVMVINLGENDIVDIDENVDDLNTSFEMHPRKKRRAEDHYGSDSSNLDSSIPSTMPGLWKQASITKLVANQGNLNTKLTRSNDPVWDIMPLHLNSKGQAKGTLAIGSRMRMGKNT